MNNFTFRFPPPPPLPAYSPTPPPPPPPVTTTCNVQPPPLPPQTTVASWGGFDFTRPPPPLVNSLQNTTTNGISLGLGNLGSNPIFSSALNQDKTSYFGINNGTSNLHMMNNSQQPARRLDQHTNNKQQNWPNRNYFKKPRNDYQTDQRSDYSDRVYFGNSDLRYSKNTLILDNKASASLDPNSTTCTSDGNQSQEVTRRRIHRKRKKPTAPNTPPKRFWTDEEADMALEVEREFNKLFRTNSLKIQFPDEELNREIVSKLHPAVETVYFQQPSNPRFCFITLVEGSDPKAVMEELNKVRFGNGYLSVEYKREREDEHFLGAEDIDPLTLYVGNLAPEVTKEDMLNFFPKNRRIDIGFAKKMRFTRYAFVSFNKVEDAIEAFKATHHADMHSKSIIVRFRRLHGTVGMPGEPKVQHPSRHMLDEFRRHETCSVTSDHFSTSYSEYGGHIDNDESWFSDHYTRDSQFVSYFDRISMNDYSISSPFDRLTMNDYSDSSTVDRNQVKQEPYVYPNDEFECYNIDDEDAQQVNAEQQPFTTRQTENMDYQNLPSAAIVKKEPEFGVPGGSGHFMTFPVIPMSFKQEPRDDQESFCGYSAGQQINEGTSILANGYKEPKKETEICEPNPEDNEEEFNTTTDFGSVLNNLKKRQSFIP